MTELAWTATRTDTIDRFNGQTPRPQDEATIIDVFEQHPQLVLRAIDETAKALTDGKITWAWSVLSARLERGTTAIREATADTGTERNKRIQNAEKWIENAGLHYDRAKDVEGDLFGDDYQSGTLGDYRDDDKLRARLIAHWHKHRLRGEQAELDSAEWNAKCKHDRAIILTAKAKAAADLAAQTGAEWKPPSPAHAAKDPASTRSTADPTDTKTTSATPATAAATADSGTTDGKTPGTSTTAKTKSSNPPRLTTQTDQVRAELDAKQEDTCSPSSPVPSASPSSSASSSTSPSDSASETDNPDADIPLPAATAEATT